MAEIDDELMARVLRWCAEAGRPSSVEEVRAALSPLSWDALLAVRAVLADAPPARPLGPSALVQIARGVSPEIAAARERENAPVPDADSTSLVSESGAAPSAAASATETRKTRGKATRRVATVVIRRARDRREDERPGDAPPPLVDELFRSEGRAILGRWVRRHGARRARLVEEVARWRRPDGSPAGEEEVAKLLDAHGLTRPFERREREEVLHAVRATGGRLAVAARALAISAEALAAVIERLEIRPDVERIRDERREDIRRRATLGDRVRLLVDEADRLEDLGMTTEIEADVRDRLREHLKALRAGHARHVAASFARTLGITIEQASSVAARFGLDLRDSAGAGAPRRAEDHRASGRDGGRGPPARGGRPSMDRGRSLAGSGRPASRGGRPVAGGGRPPTAGGRPASSGGRPMSGAGRPASGSRPVSGGSKPPPRSPGRGGARAATPRRESPRPRKPPRR